MAWVYLDLAPYAFCSSARKSEQAAGTDGEWFLNYYASRCDILMVGGGDDDREVFVLGGQPSCDRAYTICLTEDDLALSPCECISTRINA